MDYEKYVKYKRKYLNLRNKLMNNNMTAGAKLIDVNLLYQDTSQEITELRKKMSDPEVENNHNFPEIYFPLINAIINSIKNRIGNPAILSQDQIKIIQREYNEYPHYKEADEVYYDKMHIYKRIIQNLGTLQHLNIIIEALSYNSREQIDKYFNDIYKVKPIIYTYVYTFDSQFEVRYRTITEIFVKLGNI